MSISSPFIHRPVAATLLTVAVTLAGAIGYSQLPVSPLPQIDFPTILVSASLPGASPEVMAAAVATPLEKQFTRIAGVTEMTSRSSLGGAIVVLQFDMSRDINNAAARDVQAAINGRCRIPAHKSAEQAVISQNQSYRLLDSESFPDIGRRAAAQTLRHRILHFRAEAFAGPRRWPCERRRKFLPRRFASS